LSFEVKLVVVGHCLVGFELESFEAFKLVCCGFSHFEALKLVFGLLAFEACELEKLVGLCL
jgi:hypothetical protein